MGSMRCMRFMRKLEEKNHHAWILVIGSSMADMIQSTEQQSGRHRL